MQLLKITTTPIEYEMKIEHAKFEKADPMEFHNGEVQIKTQNTQMRSDSSQMRRNLGMQSNDDFIKSNAQKGIQNAMQKTAEYTQMGKQLSQIHNGTKVSDVYRNKMLNEAVAASQQVVEYVQLGDPKLTWTPPKIDLSYIKGDDTRQYQTAKSNMEYVPGRFHMDIIQLPKVSIEYVGDAIYVPASSAPGYEAPEE